MPVTGLENLGQLLLENAQTLSVSKAYNEVGFFRRAVDIRRNGVSNMPFALLQNGNEVVNEQAIGDTSLPLPIDVFDLIPTWATDLDLYGAAYGILLTDEFGLTGEGWVRLHPSRVTPVYDGLGVVTNWQINTFTQTRTVLFEKLLFIWQPNQTSDRGHGEPIARAALTASSILSFAGTFQSMFFEKGALNPTIVSIENFAKQSPTEQNKVRAYFNNLFGGLRKSHSIQTVDGKTTVNSLQQPLKDMALSELSKEQKETIAATLGVPLSLIMSNAANYATATQDDFNFYDKAIVPLVTYTIADQLNRKLFNPLGYSLSYQQSRLDAYQAIELQKSSTLNGMLDRDVINITEYRESMGLASLELEEESPETGTKGLPEIFGYHIDAGVVSKNEVRARLGLEPEVDAGKPLKDLQAKLAVMQTAVSAGIPPEQAAKMVGLSVVAPNDVKALEKELKKWERMAAKRYIEGNPEKALTFTSDIIPVVLSDKIKATLATVSTVDSVKTVFNDAVLYA